ncbi:MAG TPA: GGDEF and EAL domain-containing protein [Chromatiales bacterium]|nr:GGDEF and EAL domain-containing protein [Chromatiales bacterium]
MSENSANHLLARQLAELGLCAEEPPDPANWRKFLERVGRSYAEAETERLMLERSLAVSSREMEALYQRQRRSYEGRLHAILDALPDLLFLVDEVGRYVEVLAAQPEQLVLPREELVGKTLDEVLPAPAARRFQRMIRRALEEDRMVRLRYVLRVPAGERVFEGRCVPARYQSEGRRCALFLARDVTEEVEAARREQLIGTVFRAATEGIVILDASRRVISVNPAFERITGLTARDAVGRAPAFLEDVTDPRHLRAVWREVRAKGSWAGELTARRATGETYPLWATVDTVPGTEDQETHYLVLMSDVSAIKQSRAELEYVATHDILTGMPNRRLFMDRLEGAVTRSRRSGKPCALLFLDLDRFKAVNDTLGHQTGDALLKAVALRLERAIRASDSLARIGGDEFTVICEDLGSEADVAPIAEKILGSLTRPFRIMGNDIEISASVGIAVYPDDGRDMDELLRHADAAMYAAKQSGRACYQFFTSELRGRAHQRFMVEQRLRRALAEGSFRLVYQPQFDLVTHRIVGLEALLRLDDEDPPISPMDCVAVAEATGLIAPLGEWVIEHVLAQIAAWNALGLPAMRVAVNVSRRQLTLGAFAQWVQDRLNRTGIPGGRLEFEITESAFVEDEAEMQGNLHALRALGIRFAIDDFGTGHASLVNLKQLPLDRLKIDRAFVRDLTVDPNDEAIVRATVAMAHGLGLRVVAEGVETEAQLSFLKAAGCDEMQGFLWARPQPPEEITRWFLSAEDVPLGAPLPG